MANSWRCSEPIRFPWLLLYAPEMQAQWPLGDCIDRHSISSDLTVFVLSVIWLAQWLPCMVTYHNPDFTSAHWERSQRPTGSTCIRVPAVKTTALHVRVMYLFPFLYTSLNYVDKLSSIILAKNCRKNYIYRLCISRQLCYKIIV